MMPECDASVAGCGGEVEMRISFGSLAKYAPAVRAMQPCLVPRLLRTLKHLHTHSKALLLM